MGGYGRLRGQWVKQLQKKIIGDGSSRQGNGYIHNACDEFTLHLENSITVKSFLFFVDAFQSSQQKNIIDSISKFQGDLPKIQELQACSDEVTLLKDVFLYFFQLKN